MSQSSRTGLELQSPPFFVLLQVTDDAFQFLNRAGCALTRVDVSGCVQLTDSAAREIVKVPK